MRELFHQLLFSPEQNYLCMGEENHNLYFVFIPNFAKSPLFTRLYIWYCDLLRGRRRFRNKHSHLSQHAIFELLTLYPKLIVFYQGRGKFLIRRVLLANWRRKISRCIAGVLYNSDSRRSNIAHGTKANKQISLADQGLTRSFHWSRAIFKTSFFLVFWVFDPLTIFDFKII